MNDESFASPSVERQIKLICSSYLARLGRPLVLDLPAGNLVVRAVVEAPFVVVSHDHAAEPVFNFANQAALALWEMSWSEFIGLPSRYSAEPGEREERERLLADVAARGFSKNYSGVRVSKGGRRFRIEEAVVFNLQDESGGHVGQAATFSRWTYL